jgi:hypothetical protein
VKICPVPVIAAWAASASRAEVDQREAALLAKHDVRRLQVAVQDPGIMDRRERAADWRACRRGLGLEARRNPFREAAGPKTPSR